jgi:hypothetical protein
MMRERLVGGLANMLAYAMLEDDLELRDQLLNELHALANQYPADTTVRDMLAWAFTTR